MTDIIIKHNLLFCSKSKYHRRCCICTGTIYNTNYYMLNCGYFIHLECSNNNPEKILCRCNIVILEDNRSHIKIHFNNKYYYLPQVQNFHINIRALEKKGIVYFVEKSKNAQCSICLEDITSFYNYEITECCHGFHRNCLNEWKKTKEDANCPNCRKEL